MPGNFRLRQGYKALLAQYFNPRQTCLVCRDAWDFNVTQQEFSCNLLYRVTVFAKVQQFGGERSELANFCGLRWDPADCELHRVAGHVMQGASLPEPPNNLLIVGRKLDDLYARQQPQTAVRKKQLFRFIGIASRGLL